MSRILRQRLSLVLLIVLMGVTGRLAAQSDGTPEATPIVTYPNAHLLVDTTWVAEHLNDPTVRVIDMRSPSDYEAGHIPNAVNVPVDTIASTIDNISMQYDPDEVQAALNHIGLTPDMTAVIYDDLGMMNSARLFWTLEMLTHVCWMVVGTPGPRAVLKRLRKPRTLNLHIIQSNLIRPGSL
jgi:rhodanese-related sulfurtransferase